jgi:chemotaxis protein methyltransferase CheR
VSNPNARVRPAPGTFSTADTPRFTEEDYQRFQELFYRKTGITFGAAKRYFVERHLITRMAAVDVQSLRTYVAHLKYEDGAGAEQQELINALTVNETYFYREAYQFRCLVTSILPDLIAKRPPQVKQPIRIWSLPCATGEEPYSLALQLLENWPDVDRFHVEIVGSDIDTRVLELARRGLYEERSVQHLSQHIRQRYFTQTSDGRWQISDDIRGSVDFIPMNIMDRQEMRRHQNAFDVIFCRNLLIYFDDLSRLQAAEAMFDALRPGGFICLGHSESMSRISSLFIVRKFPDAIVYQKPRS